MCVCVCDGSTKCGLQICLIPLINVPLQFGVVADDENCIAKTFWVKTIFFSAFKIAIYSDGAKF